MSPSIVALATEVDFYHVIVNIGHHYQETPSLVVCIIIIIIIIIIFHRDNGDHILQNSGLDEITAPALDQ